MKNILCYGDSNTWGYNPDSTCPELFRFSRTQRWTGRLQTLLGGNYHVIEEGLGGRTTVFDDPSWPGRNGLKWLTPCIHTHQPLDLVLIMLGTNDTKTMFAAPVSEIARGMEALVQCALNPYIHDARVAPKLAIVAPILVGELPAGNHLRHSFDQDSSLRSQGLAAEYRRIARIYGCHFFDASQVAAPSPTDGVHLNAAGHEALAGAFAPYVRGILGEGSDAATKTTV